ncbi:MAG: hypothetical protein M1385_02695, partial [Candidatus Marsarchaeota archaeon]|nr:hypothetical protein [Candidatus Marsarchaeota archaeon]
MVDAIIEGMKIKFDEFLDRHYKEQIESLIISYPEKVSLRVDFKDLERFDLDLANELIEHPDVVIEAATLSLRYRIGDVLSEDNEPHVRFYGQTINNPLVQDVGSKYISKMISLDSLIVKRSEINPKIKVGTYRCTYCNATYRLKLEKEEVPEICSQCRRKSIKEVPEESKFVNLQKIAVIPPPVTDFPLTYIPFGTR